MSEILGANKSCDLCNGTCQFSSDVTTAQNFDQIDMDDFYKCARNQAADQLQNQANKNISQNFKNKLTQAGLGYRGKNSNLN
jgi:hypothetical protein